MILTNILNDCKMPVVMIASRFNLILYYLQYDWIQFQILILLITIHRNCSYNLQYDSIPFPITISSNRYYDI
jgi:hypothetical protein